MSLKTKPTTHLFTLHQKVYAVACHTCHPDTQRIVILFEKPSAANKGQGLSVSARYKDGKYHGVISGDPLPIFPEQTLWMESPFWEGPYFVANVTTNTIMNDLEYDTVFHDPKAAALHVNELNTGSFGNPTYTVVTEFGVGVDYDGFLTQFVIQAKNNRIGQRYAERIDDTKQCVNLNFGSPK